MAVSSPAKRAADYPFVGIPAFVYRKFRHSCAYVNVNAGIDKPEDLKGKRVGVPEWQMTATVWLRGFLQDDYDVRPRDIHWFTGGLESSERKEKVALKLPPEIKIENIPAGKNLSDMLVTGEIDALLTAQVPAPYVKRAPQVRRLFADPRAVETDHFRRTGIFPIMHVMVLRQELYPAPSLDRPEPLQSVARRQATLHRGDFPQRRHSFSHSLDGQSCRRYADS